jgi:hypothetical protein
LTLALSSLRVLTGRKRPTRMDETIRFEGGAVD